MALFLANQLLEFLLLKRFSENGFQGLCKLDCIWYTGIAAKGYQQVLSVDPYSKMANWAFFPLFPMAVRALAVTLGLRFETAAILTSKLFFLIAIYAFIKVAKSYLPRASPLGVGLIVAFNPYAIYGNTGYTESLFLLLTSLFFLLLHRSKLAASGLVGLLLTATRLAGISTLLSYLIVMGEQWGSMPVRKRWAALVGLLLLPLGLLGFMLYLKHHMGDPLAFVHIQKAWRGERPSLTLWSWVDSLKRGLLDPAWFYRYFALSGMVALGISVSFLWDRRFRALAAFSLSSTILPLMSDSWGLPRYLWWQAPVLLFIAALTSRKKLYLGAWLVLSVGINVACYRQWFSDLPWLIS